MAYKKTQCSFDDYVDFHGKYVVRMVGEVSMPVMERVPKAYREALRDVDCMRVLARLLASGKLQAVRMSYKSEWPAVKTTARQEANVKLAHCVVHDISS